MKKRSQDQMDHGAAIPAHLPNRLAIAFWIWNWATHIQPGETFHDLERQFVGLKERGFNAVRIEAFPSTIFSDDGKIRAEVEFANVVEANFGLNCPSFDFRGGHRINLLERLLLFFRLAGKHGIFVALSSWEYQPGHSAELLADPSLRNGIQSLAKRVDERARVLTCKWEMLLTILKQEDLLKQIAYVEIHNEWTEVDKQPAEEALAYLTARFPELLFCMDCSLRATSDGRFDFNRISSTVEEMVARNTQVFDFHLYSPWIQDELFKLIGLHQAQGKGKSAEEIDRTMEELEKSGSFLRGLMRSDYLPWREFKRHLRYDTFWKFYMHLYHNLNPDRWDQWMFANYPRYEERMRTFFKNMIQYCGHIARRRGIPAVCDEGYIFYPPVNSQFEPSAVGRGMFEHIVSAMLENDFWGIMISTYACPGQPLWETRADWLLEVNRQITACPGLPKI